MSNHTMFLWGNNRNNYLNSSYPEPFKGVSFSLYNMGNEEDLGYETV